mgnify:CR=1 FL=1
MGPRVSPPYARAAVAARTTAPVVTGVVTTTPAVVVLLLALVLVLVLVLVLPLLPLVFVTPRLERRPRWLRAGCRPALPTPTRRPCCSTGGCDASNADRSAVVVAVVVVVAAAAAAAAAGTVARCAGVVSRVWACARGEPACVWRRRLGRRRGRSFDWLCR